MKNLKLLVVALVAMFGVISCSKDCGHDFVEVDYSKDIVGTWTALEPDHYAAYIFNADGTLSTTGFDGEAYWEDEKGTYSVVNNKITMKFESGRVINGSFDIIPGKTISIVGEKGRHTYEYCKDDFSDEVVGMWVCTYVSTNKEDMDFNIYQDAEMAINVYQEDGKSFFTGLVAETNDFMANVESTYKVIGDLMIESNPLGEGLFQYNAFRLTYSPNANQFGDMLTKTSVMAFGDEVIELYASMLRVKQSLDLASKKYDYIKTFVTNVDGLDKDINFMGFEFNFAKMDGVKLDKMLKTLLFNVEFPDANTIKYACHYNNEPMSMDAPIVVDGNKMTVKMSTKNAAYKDVDLYTFQDKDNTQMHMYMSRTAFINFFGNMQATMMSQMGNLDLTDAAAVKAVFDSIDEAVETINVSFVMEKAAK